MEYYSALKKNKVKNYREWIILKCIILIEVIYSQEKKLHVLSDMWRLANNV